jgi:hypothetical protein
VARNGVTLYDGDGEALARQIIRGGASHHAATDNDHVSTIWHQYDQASASISDILLVIIA